MAQDTPTNQDLAFLLFSCEWAGGSRMDELHSAGQRTFEKLNTHLTKRFGLGGYRVLLKRALTLAATDFPWLGSVSVTENGTLEGLDPLASVQIISETAEGYVAILARLIGLLETFIGRELCLRVLHNVWPDAVQIDTQGSQGDSSRETAAGRQQQGDSNG